MQAAWIVERSKGIHQGVEDQATANGTYLIGKTGAEKEDAITVRDGLG